MPLAEEILPTDRCGKGLHELSWCSQLCNGFSSPRAFSKVTSSLYSQHPVFSAPQSSGKVPGGAEGKT